MRMRSLQSLNWNINIRQNLRLLSRMVLISSSVIPSSCRLQNANPSLIRLNYQAQPAVSRKRWRSGICRYQAYRAPDTGVWPNQNDLTRHHLPSAHFEEVCRRALVMVTTDMRMAPKAQNHHSLGNLSSHWRHVVRSIP